MTMNAAHARGHRRDSLHSATGDSEPITDSGRPTCDADRCPHRFPGCPDLRCQRPTHDGGICHVVGRSPYFAAYWEAGT
jgi:hypothetical protein